MTLNFTISELCISGEAVPIEVADKLLKYHILPLQPIRERMGVPIMASQNSGYRSYEHEIARGRSGSSQHTFGIRGPHNTDRTEKGAIDWTCSDLDRLQDELISNTSYTRICRYHTFIHCDYKPTRSGKRELYRSGADSKWQFQKYLS